VVKPLQSFSDIAYFLLRVVAGLLFACHGAQKLLGVLGGQQPPVGSLLFFAGIIELFGGVCIAAGILTAPVALIASGEMAVAYFRAHAPQGVWPIVNRGELAVLYCFLFLYIATRGGGKWTLTKG
jgi:putative oxidoreductase